jgi:hypothetical protein
MMFAEALKIDDAARAWIIDWLNSRYSAGLEASAD